MDVCPEQCLQLVPLEQIDFPPAVLGQIQKNEQLYKVELDDVAAEELGVITSAAMLLPGHGAIAMDKAYMDVEKGRDTVASDLASGREIQGVPVLYCRLPEAHVRRPPVGVTK